MLLEQRQAFGIGRAVVVMEIFMPLVLSTLE